MFLPSAGGSDASTTFSQTGDHRDVDQLTLGQRVLVSNTVAAESLRGRVGVILKVPKRGVRYTVSVANQKFKSSSQFLELAPFGEELRQLASDVLYDWLPATGGWVAHEDCREDLLLDFIDGVRACQAGERPVPLNTQIGSHLGTILETEEEPTDAMACIMANAYLDLPNPLCNPWQRDRLWPYACPKAKLKYRTPIQKMMDSFADKENTVASSCEPMRIQSLGAEVVKPISDTPETHCVVCLSDSNERRIDWIFRKCGHCCLCKPCVRKLHDHAQSDLIECPLCRCVSTVVPSRVYKGKVYYAE